jgi:hypothetical protein
VGTGDGLGADDGAVGRQIGRAEEGDDVVEEVMKLLVVRSPPPIMSGTASAGASVA